MKNKFLILSILLMSGCVENNTSTPSTNSNTPSSTISSKVEESSSSSTDEIEFIGGNTSSSKEENNDTPVIDNSKNMIDMDKVLNLQCSGGTMYGQQFCTGDNGAYNGSWYADWEGWWCEYTQVGDYGVDVKSPEDCDYSGADSWYVQLSIPLDTWDGEKDYVFSFDLKSTVDTGTQAPIKTPAIEVNFNKKNGDKIYLLGTITPNNPTTKHYEFNFTTYTGSIESNENFICLFLGGRGHIEYEFRNLYIAEV